MQKKFPRDCHENESCETQHNILCSPSNASRSTEVHLGRDERVTAAAAYALTFLEDHSMSKDEKHMSLRIPLQNALHRESNPDVQALSVDAITKLLLDCTRTTAASSQCCQMPLVQQLLDFSVDRRPLEGPLEGKLLGAKNTNEEIYWPPCSTAAQGVSQAMRAIAKEFAHVIFERLPQLWGIICDGLYGYDSKHSLRPLQVLRVIECICSGTQSFHITHELLQLMESCMPTVSSKQDVVLRMTFAWCFASSSINRDEMSWMTAFMERLLAMLEKQHEGQRETAALILCTLLNQLQSTTIAPYVRLLMLTCLRFTCDSNRRVRLSASQCFAILLPLWPLRQASSIPTGISYDGARRMQADGDFLCQLFERKQIENVVFPSDMRLKVTLRPYQKDGISWLCFLRRVGLHGALCDDMGLGKVSLLVYKVLVKFADLVALIFGVYVKKLVNLEITHHTVASVPLRNKQTMQTLIAIATKKFQREAETKQHCSFLSLVVCPTTLMSQWVAEVEKVFDPGVFQIMQYSGTPASRQALSKRYEKG